MRASLLIVFLAALSSSLTLRPSAAEELHGKRPPPGLVRSDERKVQEFHRDFRDGDLRHFPDRDHDVGGRHDDHRFHGGHGGPLSFYPEPIYPYPDFYYDMPPPLYEAPQVPGYWYYCDNPPGYYPYVAECRRPWNTVAPGDAPPPG